MPSNLNYPMILLLGGTRSQLIVIIYTLNEIRKIRTITHRSGSRTIYNIMRL